MDNYNTGIMREKYVRFYGTIGFLDGYCERLTGSILYRAVLGTVGTKFLTGEAVTA